MVRSHMTFDVANFVSLASLHDGVLSEDRLHGGCKSLRSVETEQRWRGRVEAAFGKIRTLVHNAHPTIGSAGNTLILQVARLSIRMLDIWVAIGGYDGRIVGLEEPLKAAPNRLWFCYAIGGVRVTKAGEVKSLNFASGPRQAALPLLTVWLQSLCEQ